MSCPKAVCQSCGRLYSGWDLAHREICDCGGKLAIDYIYGTIIGYLRAGRHKDKKEEVNNVKLEHRGK